jgi:hypothetical protein
VPGYNTTVTAQFTLPGLSGLAGRNFEIRLDADEALSPRTLGDGSLPNIKGEAGNPVSITVQSRDGATQRTLSLNAQGSIFKLAADANVVLAVDNVTLHGLASNATINTAAAMTWNLPGPNGESNAGAAMHIDIPDNAFNTGHIDNTASLVYVGAGNEFVMNAGSAITGNATPGPGGGVQVAGGVFTMNAGSTISGNAASLFNQTDGGGGVNVSGGGKVSMKGGAISGNGAGFVNDEWGGGVAVSGAGTSFDMSGGAITGNYCRNWGGGVAVVGGGQFTMSGADARISGNRAVTGGGVGMFINAQFTMLGENAAISGNTAAGNAGGGVAVRDSQFIMSGANAAISGNTANGNLGGGGVYASSGGTFTMSGAASRISGNASVNNSGGGVFLRNGAQFTMSGGMILDNTWGSGYETNGNFSISDNNGVPVTWPLGTRAYTADPGEDRSQATPVYDGTGAPGAISSTPKNIWAEQ